jgi:uncharacterized membrane protein YagU involved in acid resistance
MSANTRTSSVDTLALKRPRAFETILYGGLAVGVLDGLDALTFFGLRGVPPANIFQYIASALMGHAAYKGGAATVAFGVLLHFFVALILATIYYALSRRFPLLIRRAVICGMVYGVIAYFTMNFLVVPSTAAAKIPFSVAPFINGIIGHALLIGLPIALIARWSVSKQR